MLLPLRFRRSGRVVAVLALAALTLAGCWSATTQTPRSPHAAQPSLRPGMTEDEIFDATAQPPLTLLQQLYEEHQLLVLGYGDHENAREYYAVADLLAQVGRDPHLRYIVLERFGENASALEAASVTALSDSELQRRVLSPFDSFPAQYHGLGRWSLCGGEWGYTWVHVLPQIRALNARRPRDRPLLVTTVDQVSRSALAGLGPDSYLRDSATAVRFHERIWTELQRDPRMKALVVYNLGHLFQGFTTVRNERPVLPDFFDIFLHAHPEAKPRTALVSLEGVTEQGQAELTYQFKFTARQVARAPGRAFGVRLTSFRDVMPERGEAVFVPAMFAFYERALGYKLDGTAALPDMVDAIVVQPAWEQSTAFRDNALPICRNREGLKP